MASSSICLKRLEPLCCFLPCWLLRGVAEGRDAAAEAALGRCWKKWPVGTNAGWFWAGEAGPEGAEALEDDAMAGGFVDMVPSQGSTAATVTMTTAEWARVSLQVGGWEREGGRWERRKGSGGVFVWRGAGSAGGGRPQEG